MNLILKYMKPYRGKITLTMALKFIGVILELMIPYLLEYMIDEEAPKRRVWLVIILGLSMILLAFIVRTCNVTANRMATRTARDGIHTLRDDLFRKTIYLSGAEFDRISLPSLISRMTSDSYNVQSFIGMIQRLGVRAPIMLIGGLIVAWTMEMHLALVLLCIIPLMAFITIFVSFRGIKVFRKVQEKLDDVVRILRENITGMRIIRALSKSDYEKKRFFNANKELTQTDIGAGMMMALPHPIMNLFLNVGLTIIIVIGAYRVNDGYMKPGVILAFLTYFNMILQAVMGINRIFMQYSKAGASADRIAVVMAAKEDVRETIDEEPLDIDTVIEFENVSFCYGDNSDDSVKDISFKIHKGESLGIIGSTGCGKTTLINLLLAFYNVENGVIRIHGRDIAGMSLHDIRDRFGVVFQNDTIFNDTIYDNISFGRNISMDKVKLAAETAMLSPYIDTLSSGYDYMVAIKGMNLSGGQRQRLLIARALAKEPEILILDDSSSALDYKTDAAIRNNIENNYGNITKITVAQRISSVKDMSHIIVMDEGRIISQGTHDELIGSCEVYKDIYMSQMGAFD